MVDLTIGEIARQAHLPTSTLRYYESVGLLLPAKRVSGQRRYDSAVVKRLTFIRLAQETGFTIAQIKILLGDAETDLPPLSDWQKLGPQKLNELEEIIQHTQQMKDLLTEALDCSCPNFDECYACL